MKATIFIILLVSCTIIGAAAVIWKTRRKMADIPKDQGNSRESVGESVVVVLDGKRLKQKPMQRLRQALRRRK